MKKVRWGVLSTSRFAVQRVIPAMQKSEHCEIVAIGSRSLEKARAAANSLGIPEAYGSYEDLLAAVSVEAIYNPLPNHMHVPWSIRALESGKHVLCEKPIALSASEAQLLLEAAMKRPELKIMEAFVYRHHPQWQLARRIVQDGGIGELRTIQSFFSFWNADPTNIRNIPEVGGGALWDIGCYCISLSRFLFGREPERVFGVMEYDRSLNIDSLTSGILDFHTGTSTFTCSMQLAPFQSVGIFGTGGRVEFEIPFSAPSSRMTGLWHKHGNDLEITGFIAGDEYPKPEALTFEPVDQYTVQGDDFSRAVMNNTPVPTPLEDAVANMRVIDAIAASSRAGSWIVP